MFALFIVKFGWEKLKEIIAKLYARWLRFRYGQGPAPDLEAEDTLESPAAPAKGAGAFRPGMVGLLPMPPPPEGLLPRAARAGLPAGGFCFARCAMAFCVCLLCAYLAVLVPVPAPVTCLYDTTL